MEKHMEKMTKEMPQFDNVDQVRAEGEIKKKAKTEEKQLLESHLEQIKIAVQAAKKKFDDVQAELRQNEVHQKLQAYEIDLRKKSQENYLISETIEENRRKTNYSLVKRSCLSLVKDINAALPN